MDFRAPKIGIPKGLLRTNNHILGFGVWGLGFRVEGLGA